MATSTRRYHHQDYTVAWVCALPLEMAAAVAMLDERHCDLPVKQNDDNSYILGRVHAHNVVIACLPSGVYGTTSATTVAAQMRYSFKSIRFFLMVGIGGGAPSEKNDIRLGDVVVSKPTMNFGGVIQYDFGKALSGGRFERVGVLNKPPPILLSAISKLQATYMPNPSQFSSMISEITIAGPTEENIFACPGESQDILFDQEYDHSASGETCSSCDMKRLIQRPPRDNHGPVIHYGLIASGNQVIKDSRIRDKLAQEHDILCFEMEAAGLMDNFPCLWQSYAAATAAGYAKVLLSAVPDRQIVDAPPAELGLSFYAGDIPYQKTPMDVIPHQYTSEELLEKMSNYEHKKVHWKLSQKRLHNTTQWFLDHPNFKEWFIEKKISSLWCSGKIGSGKTMIATAVIDAAKYRASEHKSPVVFFYCDYEYNDELDASFIISSFIKQICEFHYQNFGYFPEDVAPALRRFFGPERTRPDFDDLEHVFSRLCRVVPDTVYIIDGIDALQEKHAIRFLKFVQQLFSSPRVSHRSRVLLLSRDQVPGYINVGTFIHGICQIPISTNATQDIESYIETSITEKMMYRKLTDDVSLLKKIKETLHTESSNMFLWVHLQLEILWDTCRTDADIRHALTALPKNLEETYKRCVSRIDFQDDWALKALKWVSFAKRPLHIEELREAVAFHFRDTKWDPDKKPQRDFIIGCCANLIVLDPIDNCVRFAHSSVKQYLEEDMKREPEERSIPGYFTEQSGDLECGEYCITYLSFSDFSLQLSKISPGKTIVAVPSPYSVIQSIPTSGLYKLFFRKPQGKSNSISVPLPTPAAPSRSQYRFLDYATNHWALHTKKIHSESLGWENFVQLAMHFNATWNFHPWVSGGRSKASHLHGLFGWAVKERHKPLLSLVSDMKSSLRLFCDLPVIDEGLPAIHIASKLGYQDIVQILLNFCDVNNFDQDGCTPLHHAASNGHYYIARLLLLQKGIKFDVNSTTHCTPLWLAASHGHIDILALLIEKGAKIESQDKIYHRTPLCRALENEHYAIANLLLGEGAQIKWLDTYRQTPFALATARQSLSMIYMLINNDNEYTSEQIAQLLRLVQLAIENGWEALAKLLVRRNSDHLAVKLMLEEIKEPSQELLLLATKGGHTTAVEQILKKGADPDFRDTAYATPLHWAACNMETPLHWAAKADHVAAIKLLIACDAEIDSKDKLWRTPLHEAAKCGQKATIKLLLESGANINSKDRRDTTPLDLARRTGETESMNLLLESGAEENDMVTDIIIPED
ncbi:putative ankyrin repeat-containing protein [Trichoderma evansii]